MLDQFYDTLAKALPQTDVEHVIVTRPIDLLKQPKQAVLSGVMKSLGKRPNIQGSNVIDFKDTLEWAVVIVPIAPHLMTYVRFNTQEVPRVHQRASN